MVENKLKIEKEFKVFIAILLFFVITMVSFCLCVFQVKESKLNSETISISKDESSSSANVDFNRPTFSKNESDDLKHNNIIEKDNNSNGQLNNNDGNTNSDFDLNNDVVIKEPVVNLDKEIDNSNEQVVVTRYIANLNDKLKKRIISLSEGYWQIDDLHNLDSSLRDMKYIQKLREGWVKVNNNNVEEYTFYFDDCMVSRIKYVEYVDPSTNVTQSNYTNSNDIIKTYKYEEEYRIAGEANLDYTISQNFNTIDYDLQDKRFEYTGKMKYYNVQDFVTFGNDGDYGVCLNSNCEGCIDCITDWTRCIETVTNLAMLTGGVIYFPTGEYLVDLDDDSGLEYEILPNGTRSSFDASRTRNNRGRGIFLSGNYITYKENNVDIPRGYAPIIFDLCGSKIKLEKNHMANYSVIEARNCKYIEIKNGTIQGDRMEHDYTEFLYDGVNKTKQSGDAGDHTQGYGIKIRSTERGIVSNMDVYDVTADALCFNDATYWTSNYPVDCVGNDTNIEVKYTYAHHSRRQGITVGDITSINIHHTEIAYIGGGNTRNSNGTYSLDFGWAYEEDRLKYEPLLSEEDKNIVGTLGVGRNPMAGIDFEPDRGTFQVKKAIVDNCYIHTTEGFTIVGVGCSTSHHTTCDMTISNSFIDGFICLGEDQDEYYGDVFYPAEKIVLKNNIILHSDIVSQRGYVLDENLQGEEVTWSALQTTHLDYIDCILRKTYRGHISFFNISNTYDGCIIEQDVDTLIYLNNPPNNTFTPNGYFRFAEKCNIKNTTFRNLIGAQVNGPYWYAYGIIFINDGLGENYGNKFENCSVFLHSVTMGMSSRGTIIDVDKTTKFINGIIYVYRQKTIINNCAFNQSITNASTSYLELNYCIMINTQSIFRDKNGDSRADRYINNCYFHFDNESMFASRLNRGPHWGGLWKNSVLRIEKDVNVSNLKCEHTLENKLQPHFTFMSMTDLDDVEVTQISLNKNMEGKANLLYRNNHYVEEDNLHSGSHDYKGLSFYSTDNWLGYMEIQSKVNTNKIYKLAYTMMKSCGYY